MSMLSKPTSAARLSISNLSVNYGKARALANINLSVEQQEIITIIGLNGAGKTTLMRSITGLKKISEGEIIFNNKNLAGCSVDQRVKYGIAMVPEGRSLFPKMTVRENLVMGAYTRRDKEEITNSLDKVMNLFPDLKKKVSDRAESLSGGQQQMVAIGRALMSDPRLLLLDEPSIGLAPIIVQHIAEMIKEINRQHGVSILLVEQNARVAMSLADRVYVLETGEIVLEGPADKLRENTRVQEAYLGMKVKAG
ncbi:ABC transporter ATP-binding protein [Metallumcola ferriviriculae]|uniref:ABC transporter ATP-binding protein n=1 Tax=Metallumcola ferriviriculae TaxID=3039180 RepID=A0AAU0UMN6_9FIRM|nr:ABC transporter ATP-binding protein [Desulfitibacteraceae bacterium MK1]